MSLASYLKRTDVGQSITDGPVKEEDDKGYRGCGVQQPLIGNDGLKLLQDKRLFPASEVYTALKKIPDKDLHLLGLLAEYARPEWMISTVPLDLLPPLRPRIAEHDATHKLGDTIGQGTPAHVVNEFEQLLQVRIVPLCLDLRPR
ncbi:hypothetical protein C8Q76DRAFT_771871 [Earliella scabrosa]|nr:hypothetical protein C8Q76DRAFT_771871 [Earliella scabrosa]